MDQAVKRLGPIAYIIKARITLLRHLGSALSPFNAFLIMQGIETLALRIQRHSANALAIANYLGKRPQVEGIHPSMQTGVFRARAEKYLKGGYGGLVGFELAAGKEAGRRFIDALQLFYHVANIGDVRSLAIQPATTTRCQLSPAEQHATGVTEGYVRLSIGLEHIDDIVADIERGSRGGEHRGGSLVRLSPEMCHGHGALPLILSFSASWLGELRFIASAIRKRMQMRTPDGGDPVIGRGLG